MATLINMFGEIYKGQFVDGIKKGLGSFTWPSGDVYLGEWSNGMRNGYGVLTKYGKDSEAGHWLNGKLDKPKDVSSVFDELNILYPENILLEK